MEFVDVTDDLLAAIKSLSVGDMVSSDTFSLEEAMSSIELMDAKMDPGYLLHQKEDELSRTRAAIRAAQLDSPAQCRLADIIIGEIFNWFEGHLFIQTVHSNLFVVDRELLACKEVSEFSQSTLQLCSQLREFIAMTSVCADEDFVSFMFDVETTSSSSPQVVTHESPHISEELALRFKFLSGVGECMNRIADATDSFASVCSEVLACIDEILRDLPMSVDDLIEMSIDRNVHRNLLPVGPPRVVPSVQSSQDIYSKWQGMIQALSEASILVGDEHSNPLEVIYKLNRMRAVSGSANCFVRSCMYHRMYRLLDANGIMQNWVRTCCGGNLDEKCKKFEDEWKFFNNDMVAVFGRTVHLLCRSPSRQHRNMDHLLSDWSIMQHRAWDIYSRLEKSKSKSSSPVDAKGLWNAVALIATTLIQIHLLLVIELDLADLHQEEIGLLFYLTKTCLRTKLFVMDDLLTLNPHDAVIRNEVIHTAAEHSVCAAIMSIVAHIYPSPTVPSPDLERLFELRTLPLRSFPLPAKEVSLENYLEVRGTSGDERIKRIDDALDWMQRVAVSGDKAAETPLLRGRLADVKRALLFSKLTLMKALDESASFNLDLKHHPLVPCIVSP